MHSRRNISHDGPAQTGGPCRTEVVKFIPQLHGDEWLTLRGSLIPTLGNHANRLLPASVKR